MESWNFPAGFRIYGGAGAMKPVDREGGIGCGYGNGYGRPPDRGFCSSRGARRTAPR